MLYASIHPRTKITVRDDVLESTDSRIIRIESDDNIEVTLFLKPDMYKSFKNQINYMDYDYPEALEESSPEPDIANTVVFRTQWSWHDVLSVLPRELRDAFNNATKEEQEKIVDYFTHALKKGLEGGIMHDWVLVMEGAIDFSGLRSALKIERDNQEQISHGRSEQVDCI